MFHADYHVHSEFSSDSSSPMTAMVEAAVKAGIKDLCFTDHYDLDYPRIVSEQEHEPYFDFLFDPAAYQMSIKKLKEQQEGKINLHTGIELGLQPQITGEVTNLFNQYSFEFVIGSSHLLYGLDPYYASFWKKQQEEHEGSMEQIVKHCIHDYFQTILTNISLFPQIHVYGHLDYVVRYAPGKGCYYQVEDSMDLIDEILKTLIAKGKGIECNTSGYKSGLGVPNPHPKILKRYKELGGEILTIGSDAHSPEYIAYEYKKAFDVAKACGYHYYTIFQHGRPVFLPID